MWEIIPKFGSSVIKGALSIIYGRNRWRDEVSLDEERRFRDGLYS